MTRVAVVTGSTYGIGRATAARFSEAGWWVVGIDRVAANAEGSLIRIVADLSVPAEVERAFERIGAEHGHVDALVNNAAVQLGRSLGETGADEWDELMAINVRAIFLTVRAALPLLATPASIVNVGSVHSLATSVNVAAYAASKGAVAALTRAMAVELAPRGIRVNGVLPGAIDTAMLREGLRRGQPDTRTSDDELLEELARRTVLGRIGQAEEVARSIYFLSDPLWSSFVTGHLLVVDGGATARLSTE